MEAIAKYTVSEVRQRIETPLADARRSDRSRDRDGAESSGLLDGISETTYSSRWDSPYHPSTPVIGGRWCVGVSGGRRSPSRFTRGARLHNLGRHFHHIIVDTATALDKIGWRDNNLFKNLTALDALTHLMIESGANRFGHDFPCFPVSRILASPPGLLPCNSSWIAHSGAKQPGRSTHGRSMP